MASVGSPLTSESDGELYEVERLLGKRTHKGKVEYLIRWKGFGKEVDSWEPVKNLKGCQPLIKNFNKTCSPSPGRKAKTPKKSQAIQKVQTPKTPKVEEYTKLKTPTTRSSDFVILHQRKGSLTFKQETKEEKEVEVTTKTESVEAEVEKKDSIVKEGPSKPLPPKKTSPVVVNAKKEVLRVFAAVAVLTFFILILFSFVHVVGDK